MCACQSKTNILNNNVILSDSNKDVKIEKGMTQREIKQRFGHPEKIEYTNNWMSYVFVASLFTSNDLYIEYYYQKYIFVFEKHRGRELLAEVYINK